MRYRWLIEISGCCGDGLSEFFGTREDMEEYTDCLEDEGYEIWGIRRMEEMK